MPEGVNRENVETIGRMEVKWREVAGSQVGALACKSSEHACKSSALASKQACTHASKLEE